MDARILVTTLTLMTVAFAGCADGGDGPLAMTVDVPDNPVSEEIVARATGSYDTYLWNFNDGTGTHEGKTVRHVLGFTDGTLKVAVTGVKGEVRETIEDNVVLGSGSNALPDIQMVSSTNWVRPGEPVTISMAGSSDANNDPLLVKWTCNALGQPLPYVNDGHVHGAAAGVPFGVNVLTTYDANLTDGESVDGDLCSTFGDAFDAEYGTTMSYTGSFAESGVYHIDVYVKDPKSKALIGRLEIFVTDEIPPATQQYQVTGSLNGGFGGQLQSTVCNELGETCDQQTQTFRLDLPIEGGTITWDASNTFPVGDVTWEIRAGGQNILGPFTESTYELGFKQLVGDLDYNLVVTVQQGLLVDYTFTIDANNIIDPYLVHEPPLQ